MPRLILLNGPPGIGKSTLALRYIADHPLALSMDVDGIRRLLGRWQEFPQESGELARAIAIAMITEHLGAGYDVIVPQYLGRLPFIDRLERAAADTGSTFHEVVLMDTRENAVARFHARADDGALTTHHHEAAAMTAGGDGELGEMYDRLAALVDQRPRAHVVRTTAGDADGAYGFLLTYLDEPR